MERALANGERPDRRYCEQCDKHVVNLAALSRAEAEQQLTEARESGRRLCVRVVRDLETGKVLTREDLPRLTEQIARTRPRPVAAALALALLNWACSADEAEAPAEEETRTPPVLQGHSAPGDEYRKIVEPLAGDVTVGDVAPDPPAPILQDDFATELLELLGYSCGDEDGD